MGMCICLLVYLECNINYRLLEDYDKRNLFDIEKYLERKGKVKISNKIAVSRM